MHEKGGEWQGHHGNSPNYVEHVPSKWGYPKMGLPQNVVTLNSEAAKEKEHIKWQSPYSIYSCTKPCIKLGLVCQEFLGSAPTKGLGSWVVHHWKDALGGNCCLPTDSDP